MSFWQALREDRNGPTRPAAAPARRANAATKSRKQQFTVEALEDRLVLTASVGAAGAIQALIEPAVAPLPGTVTTTLAASTTHSVYGQPVVLTSTVTPNTPGVAATGNVSFFDGFVLLGVAPIVNGTAKIATWSEFLVGTNPVQAAYWGDSNYSVSNSASADIEVTAAPTVTTLSSAGGTSLTATVGRTTPGGGVATGVVAFYDNNRLISSVLLVNGHATINQSALGGNHSFTAVYYGDSNFNSSVSTHKVKLTAVLHHAAPAVLTTSISTAVPFGFRPSLKFGR